LGRGGVIPIISTQIELLHALNGRLSESKMLKLPPLITNDYVQRALDVIEVRLSETEDSDSSVSSTDGRYVPSCQMLHD
ncbi:MAG: hypothetical protein ACREBU_15190, partial [Nitrososphaera sp.]